LQRREAHANATRRQPAEAVSRRVYLKAAAAAEDLDNRKWNVRGVGGQRTAAEVCATAGDC